MQTAATSLAWSLIFTGGAMGGPAGATAPPPPTLLKFFSKASANRRPPCPSGFSSCSHWALIVFLLLFQLAHRPPCLQASARLRPRCRRSQTVRRPLASAPRTVARDAGAADPADCGPTVVASVGCEECLRRLRNLQLARRTTTAFAISPAAGDRQTV